LLNYLIRNLECSEKAIHNLHIYLISETHNEGGDDKIDKDFMSFLKHQTDRIKNNKKLEKMKKKV